MWIWRVARWPIAGAFALALVLAPAQGGARSRHHPAPKGPGSPIRHHGGPIYLDRTYTPAERAADLVARMTLAEKASQMVAGPTPAIPRLHIRAYAWWNEASHGVYALQAAPGNVAPTQGNTIVLDNTTSYPDDLALGSSWDPSEMYREAGAISDEAREVVPGQFLDLDFYSPTVNLARDPRWGRTDETFSEDPLLTAQMAAQFVDGLEGKNQHGRLLPQGGGYLKAIATLKHYAANNSEADRLTGSSNFDERTLREYYTDQFRQIIAQSHPGAIMSSLNEVNGTPAPADVHLIDTLARQTYGFDGYFTSDCDSVDDIVFGHHWRPPGYPRQVNATEARALANAAGEDLNCNLFYLPYDYQNLLPAATGEGIRTPTDTYNVNDMDASLVRLFTARIETGEFDNVNAEPWVLRARSQLGGVHWTNDDSNNAVTETPERLGLAQEVADRTQVLLKNAVTHRRDGSVGPLLPIHVPSSGPFKVAVIGHLANRLRLWLGDYLSDQGPPGLAKEVTPYQGIKQAIQAINPSAQVDFYEGFTGGASGCMAPACDAANTLTNIDPAAVAAAANYDYAIVDVATDWSTAGERQDRTNLDLPGAQGQLVNEVAAKNPNTIVAMQTGGDVNVGGFQNAAPAIVWSAFNGQREGAALADVLLGSYDPSGHLPFTWYQSDAQLPPMSDYRIRPGPGTSGRTYMYFRGGVSYPFGYGLSYTTFSTSNLRVNKTHLSADDTLQASVTVTNTGPLAGEDLVQLYMTTPGGGGAPIKRLAGFQQVYLTPGESRTVTLAVKIANLALWNRDRMVVRDGAYGVQIGSSAQDVLLGRYVYVHGRLTPAPSVVTTSPQMPGDRARGIQRRVMFGEHTIVEPQLTVAMNDQSLWGFIRPGHSRPLPARATVRFTSDNASVVSVVRGTIRTVSDGVATISAAVSYHGSTATGQFVVRVVSELGAIDLQSRPQHHGPHAKGPPPPAPLAGFHPDTFSYEVIVPYGRRAPKVIASGPDRSARMRTYQARRVPGVARILLTRDGIRLTYTVYFARPATNFTGYVGGQWAWIRQDASTAHVAGSALQIAAQPGDFQSHTARNLLVQPALGDWTIDSRLTLSSPPSAAGQRAGIVAYQDDGNYLELSWQYGSSGPPQIAEVTTDSLSGAPVSQVLASVPTAGRLGNTVWLRMVKRGQRYTAYYSGDGRHYAPLYSSGADLADVKVGMFAVGSGPTATFGYFHVREESPALH
jgi:beta-glucosidase